MNRLEKRAVILKESEQMDILSICQSVKNGMDGMADDWKDEDCLRILRFLNTCLYTWEPTTFKIQEKYDEAVKSLIKSTIHLINFYLKQRREANERYTKTFCPNI